MACPIVAFCKQKIADIVFDSCCMKNWKNCPLYQNSVLSPSVLKGKCVRPMKLPSEWSKTR